MKRVPLQRTAMLAVRCNGTLEKICSPPSSPSLVRCDGIFETISAVDGRPYLWKYHMRRLCFGLAALKIPPIDIEDLLQHSLSALELPDCGLLRITVFRHAGLESSPLVLIEALEPRKVPELPVRVLLSSYKKIPLTALPVNTKMLCRLDATIAKSEAQSRNCFEALRMNISGFICDVTAGNIFWLKNNVLFTPSVKCDILPGITRRRIIELSPYPVVEGEFKLSDCLSAEAVFITNVSWITLAVCAVEHNALVKEYDSLKVANHIKAIILRDREVFSVLKDAPEG